MSDPQMQYSQRQDTDKGPLKLAYQQLQGDGPGVIFCGGFRSDLSGTKACALDAWARQRGQAYLRFDYFGHGASDGAFTDGTVSHWRGDIPHMLDHHTNGPQILVGSSFGGWLSLMAALDRPLAVAGLVLIAPAVDMTQRLMWDRFSQKARDQLDKNGMIYDPSEYDPEGYPITKALIEDGRQHLLLGRAIDLEIPVRILHGQRDDAVPWQLSLELAEALRGDDVELHFIKHGDHRLSSDDQLVKLIDLVEGLLPQ